MSTSVPPLLTVRAALILGLSVITGAASGGLTFWGTGSIALALLGGGAATAGAIKMLNQIVSDTPRNGGQVGG